VTQALGESSEKQKKKRGNRANLIPWKPGQSGNPKGRPPGALSITSLAIKLLSDNDEEKAKKLARAIVEGATKGNPALVKELLDRIDGKVADKVGQDEEHPFKLIIEDYRDKK
jgi:hypothetical protein